MLTPWGRNKCWWFIFFVAIFLATLPIEKELCAAVNDDFVIVLDHSASMREKKSGKAVSYVRDPRKAIKSNGAMEAIDFVVEDLLKVGDYFALITFGDKAELFLSQQIRYAHERELLKRQINKLTFNEKHTDITTGIQKATGTFFSLKTPRRRKIVVMITDGIDDPPADSPFTNLNAKENFFNKLRGSIELNKWNFTFVGIGKGTENNIKNIVDELGLQADRAIIIENPQNSDEIQSKLEDIFARQRRSLVEAKIQELKLYMKPKLFGGYVTEEMSFPLQSFFDDIVKIKLNPENPIEIEDIDHLAISCKPLELEIAREQSAVIDLSIAFTGKRPKTGQLAGKYKFHFSPENRTPFYPYQGLIEIVLYSWLEVHGAITISTLIVFFLLTSLGRWVMRRVQVAELRFVVTYEKGQLGEPMTLRRDEHFSIANNEFTGRVVPAVGLICKTAAQVKYIGHRKFEASSMEARIFYDSDEHEKIVIGMNTPFDLKDNNGKYLRFIAIAEPGKGGDIFGKNTDPFR